MSDFEVPVCDITDPASLEAFYGPWGQNEHWRKVVLASCREMVRAESVLKAEKWSEAKIDDKARLHDNYISFLTKALEGRRIREETWLKSQLGA